MVNISFTTARKAGIFRVFLYGKKTRSSFNPPSGNHPQKCFENHPHRVAETTTRKAAENHYPERC